MSLSARYRDEVARLMRDDHLSLEAATSRAYQRLRDGDDPPPPAERRAAIREALERGRGSDPLGVIADEDPAVDVSDFDPPKMSPGLRKSLVASVARCVADHDVRDAWLSALLDAP
jgi:hypothetical protein